MAKSIAYPVSAQQTKAHWTARTFPELITNSTVNVKPEELSLEDLEIVAALNEATEDMAYIHSCFDHITDEILVDCLIYELKAVSLRHKYFLDLCKEKGIIAAQ